MKEIILITVGILIGIMLSISAYEQVGIESHERIVNHECGEYNKITGKFQWKYTKGKK